MLRLKRFNLLPRQIRIRLFVRILETLSILQINTLHPRLICFKTVLVWIWSINNLRFLFFSSCFELVLKAAGWNWSFRTVSYEIGGVYFSAERTMVIWYTELESIIFKSCDTCCLILIDNLFIFYIQIFIHSIFLVRAFFWNLYEWLSFRTYAKYYFSCRRWVDWAQRIFALSLWTWAVFIIRILTFEGFLLFIWFWPFVCAVR